MEYIRKTSHDITSNFLMELLADRKILPEQPEDVKSFIHPTEDNLVSPLRLDNIDKGYEMLKRHLVNDTEIYLVVDSDPDGYTSSAVIYLFLMEIREKLGLNFTIKYHIPLGKEHGLDGLTQTILEESNCNLVIVPDAGSNDHKEIKELYDNGYEVLVLDHHIVDKEELNGVVINNQCGNYPNRALSGVGVVYKFITYVNEKMELGIEVEKYLDLVALGMMEMSTLENRFICDYGLSHITNPFFKELVEKQSYSLGGGPLTQIGVAFYITPLMNALIRVGNNIEKERLFEALITPDVAVPSTKRGDKNSYETVCEQSARNCINAKAKQNREKEKSLELLDMQIMENCLEDNKILILNADELNIPHTLTGLCAMAVAAKYKKPVLLGRNCPNGAFKGSMRGLNNSELKDFKSFRMKSNCMDYVQG